MKRTLLIFSDIASIAEFILKFKVSNAEVNSAAQSLSAILSDEQIVIACTQFGAELQKMTSAKSFISEEDD